MAAVCGRCDCLWGNGGSIAYHTDQSRCLQAARWLAAITNHVPPPLAEPKSPSFLFPPSSPHPDPGLAILLLCFSSDLFTGQKNCFFLKKKIKKRLLLKRRLTHLSFCFSPVSPWFTLFLPKQPVSHPPTPPPLLLAPQIESWAD